MAGFIYCSCRAEISFHGTTDTLSGTMIVPADRGTRAGSNLFHSFSRFNICTNESATFTGPGSIMNIISRVTNSNNRSNINGVLRSDIPGANVFLLNPAGIVFGPDASLEISGSFYAGSAHYLRLEDGVVFHSDPANPMNSPTLTSAAPAAFGFINGFVAKETPASVEVNQSRLEVDEGKTISLVGGNPLAEKGPNGVVLNGATLMAKGGQINLIARTNLDGKAFLDVSKHDAEEINNLGDISIIANPTKPALLDVAADVRRSGPVKSAGSVSIRGSSVTLSSEDPILKNRTSISAQTGEGDGLATAVDIDAMSLTMEKKSSIDTGNRSLTSGRSGDIRITVRENLLLRDESAINSNTRNSDGESGRIFIEARAGNVVVGQSSTINSSATGGGTAGKIDVNAGDLLLVEHDASIKATAGRLGEKRPGDINLRAKRVRIVNGGLIANSVDGEGAGGNVSITSDQIDIHGTSGMESKTEGDANGGSITLNSPSITIAEGGFISSRTFGEGNAGNIVLNSRNGTISLFGDKTIVTTESKGSTDNKGKAGTAGMIEINDAHQIFVSGGSITSKTTTSGNAGKIDVKARHITLSNRASISTASENPTDGPGNPIEDGNGNIIKATGNPGEISIGNNEQLSISGGAKITAGTATEGSTGNVIINSSGIVALSGPESEISTETTGAGGGGAIDINAGQLVVENGASVTASTSSSGAGGSTTVTADTINVRSGGSIKSSASSVGKAGTITIKPRDTVANPGSIFVSGPSSKISTETTGAGGNAGAGGDIDINANQLVVENGASVTASTSSGGGVGGFTTVTANMINVRSGGSIEASTSSSRGAGGTISLNPNRTPDDASAVFVSGLNSKISTETSNAGDGGKIVIRAGRFTVEDGASVTASAAAGAAGKIGSVDIAAKEIDIRDGGKVIAENDGIADSLGETQLVLASDNLRLQNGGQVSLQTARASAGNMRLNVRDTLSLFNNSKISTSVAGGEGDGGNIDIDPRFVILDDTSLIEAKAKKGRGGNIRIVTDFLLGPRKNISASSELGIDGNVEITAVNSDVVSSVQQLPENFQDASKLMKAPCAARLAGKSSSLFVSGRQGLASQPDALVASRVSGAAASAVSGNPKLAKNRRHVRKPASVLISCNDARTNHNVL